MSFDEEIQQEPWRFDFFTVMRILEGRNPERPRIGDSTTLREDYVLLGQNPYFEFPASNLERATIDGKDRFRILIKFLGYLGPQGALPDATNAEAYAWLLERDEAFPRFLDVFNSRFLQLFFRAWADSRPIAQHERPLDDRFGDYVGSAVGLGSRIYRNLDTVPDALKLAHAGLMAPAAKSAVRLEALIRGVIGLDATVHEFVGSRLPVAREDQTRLGGANSALGDDVMLGSSFYSVSDKIRVRITAKSLKEFETVLPQGRLAEPLADLVLFYLGEAVDWDVELVIRQADTKPVKLGSFGRLGWTTWVAPDIEKDPDRERSEARFNLAQRVRESRAGEPIETEFA
ncbi:type VI secretion system baseplate subunit TssG [Prosthecomicrobium sp. N25]|uniref:type VI secretion system baseplate subunit TssG n=1 Tax=Prosthecomicrobium sp. N25 TaxID=3129254 RepID=UPI003077A910